MRLVSSCARHAVTRIAAVERVLAAGVSALLLSLSCAAAPGLPAARAQAGGGAGEFNDAHFHLTNYVQEGIDVRDFLRIMGTRVERSTLFGIPLQQQWSYANSGGFAPTY